MAIYLEMPGLDPKFGFKFLENKGDILTTPHWHREYELVLLTKGKINLGINGNQFQLEEGGIVFFNSGDIHYIVATPDSNRFVYQFDMSLFNESIVKKINLVERLNQVSQVSSLWSDDLRLRVRKILLEIVEEENRQQSDMDFVIEGLMYQLVTLMIREFPKNSETKNTGINIKSKMILETLNKVFLYVESNYENKMTLEDVAEAAGFSVYYFTRFFKKNVGQTFVEFLNNYRIDKAKWEIINTDASISAILNKVRFSSNKTFYRLFKKQTGISPKQYRIKYNIDK